MKITIRKREYAKGLFPWCPYIQGFWFNYRHGLTALCWLGYRIDIHNKFNI
jgi:hypothetical protein